MTYRLAPSLLFATTLALASLAHAAGDPKATALRLLDRLDAAQFDAAAAEFGPELKAVVPAERLRQVWQSLPGQVGPATGRGDAIAQEQGGTSLVVVPLHYAHGELLAKVAVTADGTIVGFLVQPAPPPPAPAPAADASYREIDIAVGRGDQSLPGTLTLPKTGGPFPAVVLVHGSGPQDRDETIGPNRPFLDLAHGLAERGIAVLRYEKRTKAHPEQFAGDRYTVDDETTDDAVAAIATLMATPGIDGKRIFVLGHSQGALMAPRIAAHSGHVAGLVLLAAPARPILDLLAEQNRRMAGLDGDVSPKEQAYLDDLDQRIARVRAGGDVAQADTPMNLPAGYWRSVDSVDPIAESRSLRQPMLLLQGGRDIQVVDADWQRWQAEYGRDARVTSKFYPALSHLAIAGTGPGSPADYSTPGHVDAGLIQDVAAWIARR